MAKRTIDYNRLNINLDKPETLHVLDDYKNIKGISRSKAVSQILDACVPILKDITYHRNSANELENRLLNKVYRHDIPLQKSGVAAEKHCLNIWHDKLQSARLIDFDSYNGIDGIAESKRHTRRDNGIGKVERRHIESLCQRMIGCNDSKYAIFIYFERGVVEYKKGKVAVGNGIALLAKDYFYDEYYFNFEEAILINVYDLIPLGITGIEEASKKLGVFCWVPIITYENKTVIVPVYKVNPYIIPAQRKPNSIKIIHSNVNSQIS
ncbi:hypothetical protein [Aeromonas salmonicida]|uniref:hypothetical protein n=1 Tax=Aeromonas salmonicida TaxID=645 RepID=UPI000F7AC744|nr:hypothetical protein [Aeromonas salmonicida]RSM21855.1 hypothetical protein C5B77_23215 [Aeromonas salmonicida]